MDAQSRPFAIALITILGAALTGVATSWSLAMGYASVAGVPLNPLGHAVYAAVGFTAGFTVGVLGVFTSVATPSSNSLLDAFACRAGCGRRHMRRILVSIVDHSLCGGRQPV
jgi:hypothetical protein